MMKPDKFPQFRTPVVPPILRPVTGQAVLFHRDPVTGKRLVVYVEDRESPHVIRARIKEGTWQAFIPKVGWE